VLLAGDPAAAPTATAALYGAIGLMGTAAIGVLGNWILSRRRNRDDGGDVVTVLARQLAEVTEERDELRMQEALQRARADACEQRERRHR
jgi:hypothetical protein